jgi:hypothetical protein
LVPVFFVIMKERALKSNALSSLADLSKV